MHPNWALPWARDLRSILVQTVGILGRLAHILQTARDIDEAHIFGPWAARYVGEPGPSSHDIDVLIMGDAAPALRPGACTEVDRDLAVEINPVVIAYEHWTAKKPESFVAQIKSEPQARIPLARP